MDILIELGKVLAGTLAAHAAVEPTPPAFLHPRTRARQELAHMAEGRRASR